MIEIISLGKTLYPEKEGELLIHLAFKAGIDWKHACGAKGKCTTCRFRIMEGAEALYPETEAELYFRSMQLLRSDERLACQSKIRYSHPLRIRIPKSCRLLHLNYLD